MAQGVHVYAGRVSGEHLKASWARLSEIELRKANAIAEPSLLAAWEHSLEVFGRKLQLRREVLGRDGVRMGLTVTQVLGQR